MLLRSLADASVEIEGLLDKIDCEFGAQGDAFGGDDIAEFAAFGARDFDMAFFDEAFNMPVDCPDRDAKLGRQRGLGDIWVLLDLLEQGEFALSFFLHNFIIQSLNYNLKLGFWEVGMVKSGVSTVICFLKFKAWNNMARRIHKRQLFGKWKTLKSLGSGGNGDVWKATSSSGEYAAIKLLRKIEKKAYSRFKSEIEIQRQNSYLDGVLPILDVNLPEEIDEELAWYVMPIAKPIETYLAGKHFEEVIKAISEIASTLVQLNNHDIVHRDIKPANLLVKEGEFYLGDFGLVDYPEKQDMTSAGDAIGAKWTMAPEMRRFGNNADGKPADVYSLAKTLWILLTDNKKSFDGQYNPSSINGLSRLKQKELKGDGVYSFSDEHLPSIYIKPLDDLLHESTDDNPAARPTMAEFLDRLTIWSNTYKDLQKRNPRQWEELQKQLFPTRTPQRAIWDDINDIVFILDLIGSVSALNHMFYPSGGGMDLEGARLGSEHHTIELIIDENLIELVKPKRLIFENFGTNTEWNYFRLETDELQPTGIGEISSGKEVLVELEPSFYISRSQWEGEEYKNGKYLSEEIRYVTRFFNGDFVIFQKTSKYNRISVTYDGRHNQMNTNEFRNYIAEKNELEKQVLQDVGIIRLAKEKGMSMDEAAYITFGAS
jgi:serine/threonine protein kinase